MISPKYCLLALLTLPLPLHAADKKEGGDAAAAAWWNPSWARRQKVTIDPTADTKLPDATGPANVVLRLSDANYAFLGGAEGGADIRFVSEDGKTTYPSQVEKYDSTLNEALVWVQVPEVSPGAPVTFYMYSGNGAADGGPKASDTWDDKTAAVYHFGATGNPSDSTSNANNASNAGTASEGSLIAAGERFLGGEPLNIPASPSLAWSEGGAMTTSLWVNQAKAGPRAIVLSRSEGAKSVRLVIDQGVPVVEINGARSTPGAPIAPGAWTHLAVVASGASVKLFVNGTEYSLVQAGLPALNSQIQVGGTEDTATRFTGEIDELRFDKVARSAGWVKLAGVQQGTAEGAARLLTVGESESGAGGGGKHSGGMMEHLSLFGDIAGNMMFDGWIAIGLCTIMIVVGWTVAIQKFTYLNKIQKGSKVFLKQWKELSSDLTAIDHSDSHSVKSLGGNVESGQMAVIQNSPLYQIYHIGSEEIRHRVAGDKGRDTGLSARSITAIRAALDGGLVHETHRLTKGLVFLTISIAGGPYVGLLGTVVGVMITFAIIARSGEVDVNSIAPGIASALLATVVGLIVAIPALFIYSYLNSRIKEATSGMQVFIDEFVAKMAEFYPPASEGGAPVVREQAHSQHAVH